jgi:hypothetical protein
LATLRAPKKVPSVSRSLSSDFKILSEQIP